jgi:integrase
VARVKLVFRAIVMTAYDTGERKMEILNLKRSQLHVKDGGYIDLAPQDTKTDEGRRVYLTRRTIEALQSLTAGIRSEHVFINPETGKAYRDIRKLWTKYLAEAHPVDRHVVPRQPARVHHQLPPPGNR